MTHPREKKEEAQRLFETGGLTPAKIGTMLRIPTVTIQFWARTEGWIRREDTPENIALVEYKRIMHKEEISKGDQKKLRILRNILDEYEERRSYFAVDILGLIEKHKASTSDKRGLLDDLIETVNRHTGSTIKIMRGLGQRQPGNDFTQVQMSQTTGEMNGA